MGVQILRIEIEWWDDDFGIFQKGRDERTRVIVHEVEKLITDGMARRVDIETVVQPYAGRSETKRYVNKAYNRGTEPVSGMDVQDDR